MGYTCNEEAVCNGNPFTIFKTRTGVPSNVHVHTVEQQSDWVYTVIYYMYKYEVS